MRLPTLVLSLSFSGLLLLTACGSDGGSGGGTTVPSTLQPLTSDEISTMLFVREEEKLARDVYLSLYERWQLSVFQTIALQSEQKHMDKMQSLLKAANLTDPVVDNTVGAFTSPEILQLYTDLLARGSSSADAALQVGAYIEEYDIVDIKAAIDEATAGSNQLAVLDTYMNLLCGSRNHLRSFVKQIADSGISYQPQLLSSTELNAIISTAQEQCGKQ